tara:strand:+ start:31729 stop:32601 length:873 start_codon:yes stop_codon:yes gene_type:complete
MLKKLFLLTALSLTANTAFPCTQDGSEGIVPENDMWISTTAKGISTIDEAEFNAVIDKVVAIYEPIISQMGGKLNVERNWNDGTVNAYASRRGGTWNVAMFGGLARHNTITSDGFALVVCHELGHHIGGAPKKASFWSTWASNEGQADYFSTAKCLRRVFRAETNSAQVVAEMNVPKVVIDTCSEQFTSQEDQLICQRGAMAGLSTAKLFQALRNQTTAPDFTTPDANVVSRTNDNHPATQCRLDTYYSGALCSVDELVDVDQADEAVGVCYASAGDTVGLRPKCWFSAK